MEEPAHDVATRSFNIASAMEQQAAQRPFQRGVVYPNGRDASGHVRWTHLTFGGLNSLADEYAHGLADLGVSKGDRVSLLVKPSLEFIPLVFALFKIGALPVLIDPGMGRKPFLSCIERMQPRGLIAEPVVHLLKVFFSRSFGSVEIALKTGRGGANSLEGIRRKGRGPFPTHPAQVHDEAAILFTSGSTGPAKGVTYTHGVFDAQLRSIQQLYDIQPGEIDLACFPLFGMFSMAMGMTVVIPDMDPTQPAKADPQKLVEAIQAQGCTSAFGSPAIWKNVALSCREQGTTLPSMRRILMAGAPVPTWMHQAFLEILPSGAQLHTPYGATESLPVSSIGSQEVLTDTQHRTREGGGFCVGRPAPGVEVRIIGITDAPIDNWSEDLEVPRTEIGEICVAGPVVTWEYKEEPEHTAAAKIWREGAPFHRIGDLGFLDEAGRLWFCGRKSHRVRLADGSEMYTVPCEAIFNEHPAVYRTALVGVDGKPVIVVEREPDRGQDTERLTAELRELGGANPLTAPINRVLYHPALPVDVRHNAKIHRRKLAVWAAGRS